jgi:hypothetical protein
MVANGNFTVFVVFCFLPHRSLLAPEPAGGELMLAPPGLAGD